MRQEVREPVGFQGLTLAMERWLHLGGHPSERMGAKLLAEFVGTFTLIFIGAGSVAAATFFTKGGGTGAGLITIALAHGLAIAVMVSAVGHISGGHLNPAVTVGAMITRKIEAALGVAYVLAQLVGAVAAALVLKAALPASLLAGVKGGTPLVAAGITNGQGVLIEAVLTFFLVWVVFGTAVDPRGAFGRIAGLAIGFAVAMGLMVGAPFTGAAMNPARSFGPALVSGQWTGFWVYWVGPIIGGAAAALLYDTVNSRKEVAEAPPPSTS